VDPSSDSGRDEYGLPPVDIEIPDDARDLDRDVQAYYRELRAQRRQRRMQRITRPLTRHGLVIPLVAGCLALTLLSGTLLTLLAGRGELPGTPASTLSASPQRSQAVPGLPDAQVLLDDKAVDLRTLVPAVLAWVPPGCQCATTLRQLAQQARMANLRFYLVGTSQGMAALPQLAAQANVPQSKVVDDSAGSLVLAYRPVGLTAIVAAHDGSTGNVDVVRQLQSGGAAAQRVASELKTLASAVPAATTISPSPAT